LIVGGCDIGSTTGKAVVLNDGEIVCGSIVPSAMKPELTARRAMDDAVSKAGLTSISDLDYIVGTGYGRLRVPFADENMSEISCHGRGAQWLCPAVRTIIDIGGQDFKGILLSDKGKVLEFAMNDRCAAGTGRFFEAMARVLGCGLEGISSPSNVSQTPATISSQCSVFSESEVVSLINEGRELADIVTGINYAVAGRIGSMARRVGIVKDLALTGGCSKNESLIAALERQTGIVVRRLTVDPQLIGAIGAALFASDRQKKREGLMSEGLPGERQGGR
jgi:(R)-2-hydroxyacyl-CoA dehydratese activating ATPase